MNLELYLKYGTEIWKVGNTQNEQVKEVLESELEDVKAQIEGVNRERKLSQVNMYCRTLLPLNLLNTYLFMFVFAVVNRGRSCAVEGGLDGTS